MMFDYCRRAAADMPLRRLDDFECRATSPLFFAFTFDAGFDYAADIFAAMLPPLRRRPYLMPRDATFSPQPLRYDDTAAAACCCAAAMPL